MKLNVSWPPTKPFGKSTLRTVVFGKAGVWRRKKIVSIAEEGDTVVVITERIEHLHKLRYRLGKQHDSWQILCVQPVCADCNGVEGNVSCVICQGSGWLQIPSA